MIRTSFTCGFCKTVHTAESFRKLPLANPEVPTHTVPADYDCCNCGNKMRGDGSEAFHLPWCDGHSYVEEFRNCCGSTFTWKLCSGKHAVYGQCTKLEHPASEPHLYKG